jgi:hypothetical protein
VFCRHRIIRYKRCSDIVQFCAALVVGRDNSSMQYLGLCCALLDIDRFIDLVCTSLAQWWRCL